MSGVKFLAFLILYLSYLLIGMAVFHNTEYFCEEDVEEDIMADDSNIALASKKDISVINISDLSNNLKTKNQNNNGKRSNGEQETGENNPLKCNKWDRSNSFFFAFITITTIGYGNIAPKTAAGKMFCIFYSFVGICINVILIETLEKYYKQMMRSFRRGLYECVVGDDSSYEYSRVSQSLRILIIIVIHVFLGLGVFLLIPSVIYWMIETTPTYLDSVYFTFITMTTIGFGDHVPGKEKVLNRLGNWRYIYFFGLIIWILNGLAFFLMTINVINDAFKIPAKRLKQRMNDIEEGNSNKILNAVVKIYLSKQSSNETDGDVSKEATELMENMNDQTIRFLKEIVTQTMQAIRSRASNSSDKTNVSKDTVDGKKHKSPTIIVEASETSSREETKIVKIINGKKINLNPIPSKIQDESHSHCNNYDTYTEVLAKKHKEQLKINVQEIFVTENDSKDPPQRMKNQNSTKRDFSSPDDTILDVRDSNTKSHDERNSDDQERERYGGRFRVDSIVNSVQDQSHKDLPEALLAITLREIIEAVETIEENNR